MINNRRLLGIIPARGGSKGLPRKNLREVKGKPLIAWAIEQGQKSAYIDRLILSSEDEEIIRVARVHGCDVPFRRPAELAQDSTPGIDPVLHALTEVPGYDYVVLLQPTSPLRTTQDIDGCIEMCVRTSSPACVSVTKCQQHPFLMYYADAAGRLKPVLSEASGFYRRQDYPHVFLLNGAVYIAETGWLLKNKSFVADSTLGYEMPPERSVDIDSEADLRTVSGIVKPSSDVCCG
jgi:N-acylneuraminate cytidylyltransferase